MAGYHGRTGCALEKVRNEYGTAKEVCKGNNEITTHRNIGRYFPARLAQGDLPMRSDVQESVRNIIGSALRGIGRLSHEDTKSQ